MAAAGSRKSWDSGGLTFAQPSIGTVDVEAEDAWDDRAILKAFDDALNSHTRKPVNGVEARKWDKHAAKAAADQSLSSGNRMAPPPQFSSTATPRGVANRSTPAAGQVAAASPGHPNARENGSANGHGETHGQGQTHDQGFQAADRRFTSLLAKGNAEALSGGAATVSARGVRAGIPGPWEPVAGSSEGRPPPPPQQQQQPYQGVMPHNDTEGQRFDFARPGPQDSYPRPEEHPGGGHGANGYPYPSRGSAPPHYPPAPPHPLGGGGGGGPAAGFEDGGLGRNGLPPPPAPPHPGVGPHAAAFQSLDGVPDDDLADLLLAWYYSGYYTGRYRAMQEARRPRTYRRHYHPPHPTANIPPGAPPPPTPSTYHGGGSVGGGEGWGGEPQGWHAGDQQRISSPAGSGRGSISRRAF